MRPKIIALLAVSALAVAGCSAGELSVEPTATVTVTATPEPTLKATPSNASFDSVKSVEDSFVTSAKIRSKALSVTDAPTDADVINSLHDFCKADTPVDLSSNEEFNEMVEEIASSSTCDQMDEAKN